MSNTNPNQTVATPSTESTQSLGFASLSGLKKTTIAVAVIGGGVLAAKAVGAAVEYGASKVFSKSSEKIAKQGAAAFVGGVASKLF